MVASVLEDRRLEPYCLVCSVNHDYGLWRGLFSGKNGNIKLYVFPVFTAIFSVTPLIRKPSDLAEVINKGTNTIVFE